MNTTEMTRRWSAQTPFTRVAVSAAITFATMLVLYLILTMSTLVGIHAALYRLVETQSQAWDTVSAVVLSFCIGMQLLVAYACARAHSRNDANGEPIRASETYPFVGLCILWLGGLALATANFSHDFFSGPNSGTSWNIAWMMLLCQVLGLVAICAPFLDCKESSTNNRVVYFAMGKCIPCLIYLAFAQNKVAFTLVVGTFLLDFLLHPVGEPSKVAPAEDAVNLDKRP
jgi:hypothetical protein